MYVMALPFRELEKMIYGSAAAVSEITQEAAAQPRERRLAFGEAGASPHIDGQSPMKYRLNLHNCPRKPYHIVKRPWPIRCVSLG